MVRPIFCSLNINNLRNNLFLIRKFSGFRKIWFVIKGNAYGHGIKNIYNYIYNDVDGFAVVTLNEALCLRNLGFKKYILLLEGFFDLDDIKLCIELNLIIVLHSIWQIKLLLDNVNIFGNKKIDIYLKFNNDLNRLGFNYKKIKFLFYLLKKKFFINTISLMFHLSRSSKNDSKYYYFNNYNKLIKINFYNISVFSSSGLIWHVNNIYTNWLRVGILLYGSSPTGDFNDIKKYGFKPVMSFYSKLICINKINYGQGVGYNHSYICNYKKRLVGVVACGYADGYLRQLSNKSFVLVNNLIKSRVIGYISMDMMMIDLSYNYNIKIGSIVELWGENLHIDSVAKKANTISYHLMCSINHDRVFFKYE